MPIDPVVYQPHSRATVNHVESYFIKLNSPDGSRALWIRSTLFASQGRPTRAEQWTIAFERSAKPIAMKRSYDLDAPRMLPPTGEIRYPDATFDGRRAQGALANERHRVSWDVRLLPRIGPLRPLPREWMYTGPVPEQKLTSPIPDAIADGGYNVDGRHIDVTGWRAMHGHNWGRRNTHRYVWTHASGFDEADDVILEAMSGRLLRAGIEVPWLSIACLFIGGRWVRFDGFGDIARSRASARVMHWQLETQTEGWKLHAEAWAPRDVVAGLHYWNPRDPTSYCLNTKLANLTIDIEGPGLKRRLTTTRAALEIGWPSADHGIPMYV